MEAIEKPKKSTQVPGQYLGYSLQTTRLLAKLLEAEPGTKVSLEVIDDIGIEFADGNVIVEQSKSTMGKNPVSDRSVDLWKTLSNWVDAVKSGELRLGTTQYGIYVSDEKNDDFVVSFSDAINEEAAVVALQKVKKELWGEPPEYNLRETVAEGLKPYVDNVLLADEEVVRGIIKDFKLECGSGSPHKDLKTLLSKKIIPQELLLEVLDWALGWVKRQTDMLLEQKNPQ